MHACGFMTRFGAVARKSYNTSCFCLQYIRFQCGVCWSPASACHSDYRMVNVLPHTFAKHARSCDNETNLSAICCRLCLHMFHLSGNRAPIDRNNTNTTACIHYPVTHTANTFCFCFWVVCSWPLGGHTGRKPLCFGWNELYYIS